MMLINVCLKVGDKINVSTTKENEHLKIKIKLMTRQN